jgi:tetratricopeptide (TPR) repeat protein
LVRHEGESIEQTLKFLLSTIIVHPDQADSWHQIALLKAENRALFMERSLILSPLKSEYWYNYFVLHHQEGHDRIENFALKTLLILSPHRGDSYYYLGISNKKKSLLEIALIALTRAFVIARDSVDILAMIADIFWKKGELSGALTFGLRAIIQEPSSALNYNNFATYEARNKRLSKAITYWKHAILIDQNLIEADENLGQALIEEECYEEAYHIIQNLLTKDSLNAIAYSCLGQIEEIKRQTNRPHYYFLMSMTIEPSRFNFYNRFCLFLYRQGQIGTAEIIARRALCLESSEASSQANLGLILVTQGYLEEAFHAFERALKLDQDYADYHVGLGLILLAQEKWLEGWKEYEWRWKSKQIKTRHWHLSSPRWQGERGQNKKILIYGEQGYGDILQFSRYISLVAQRGWRVLFSVPRALFRLMKSLEGVDQVLLDDDDSPDHEAHCPLMSLPMIFETTPLTIPASQAYLYPDNNQVLYWKDRCQKIDQEKYHRVGLVWAGNPRHHRLDSSAIDRRRSIDFSLLSPLLSLDNIQFYSLQKIGKLLNPPPQLIDFMDEMNDFADTAALVKTLDLVITVDTAMVHLASAVGTKVWLLDRFDSCWRWLKNREDSPWYPQLRIFRQSEPGNWQNVIDSVEEKLKQFR